MTLYLPTEETIAAVATAVAAGQGGIAVIRISGPAAEKIGKSLVVLPGRQIWSSHSVLYGYVMDEEGEERIDEVLLLLMKAPRSFTGEDVVEIHCHGGLIPVQRVLERVLAYSGVRRALPGEFSQRAVLNGRLDLTQAEAISELIAAKSQKAAQLAMTGMDGGIQKKITILRERLLDQLSEIEARIDFEDELPPLDGEKILIELQEVKKSLVALIEDSARATFLRQGLRVAIIGRPNVGKSSLLNRLSRREKAIVTDLPGTTRDLLESEIVLNSVPITLIDTAGIRATNDSLEKLGIARSHEALNNADVVLMIFDLTKGWTEDDQTLLSKIPKTVPMIIVANKVDVKPNHTITASKVNSRDINPDIYLSALTGQGEDNLINSLLKACGSAETQSLVIALNERQRDLAVSAAVSLDRVQEVANQKLPWDFWTIDLKQAIQSLGELTGEEITEAVLDRIFSRFCIGK